MNTMTLEQVWEVIASKKLPDGVHRIDGTDMLYTFTDKTSHHDVAKAVAKLEQFPGHMPWDLATPHEAIKLIDYGKHNPAVDTSKHPGIKSEYCWLKDMDASSPSDCAWGVSFGAGYIGGGYRGDSYRALAVCRPLPASESQGVTYKELYQALRKARHGKVASANQLRFDYLWMDRLLELQKALNTFTWKLRHAIGDKP